MVVNSIIKNKCVYLPFTFKNLGHDKMKLFSSILLLIVAISPQVNAIPSTKQSQLFLIGGGLKSCSSMANKNCNNKALTQFKLFKNVKQHALYKIDQKSINLVKDTWPKYFNIERKKQIIALLMLSIEPKSQAKITLETLKSQLRLNDTKDIINKIAPLCFNQNAAKTAQQLVVFVVRKDL